MDDIIEAEIVGELPPGVKRAKDGSLRTMDGKFYKGNALKPMNPGRPKRINVQEMLEAIADDFPPERVISIINKALEIAIKQQDWKGVHAVATTVLHYQIGKPVQRSITAQIDPDDFRKMFQPDSPKEEEAGDGAIGATDYSVE